MAPATTSTTSWVQRLLPAAWCVVLVALLLGPALGPGFLLTYDLVWVPDLALRPDFLGTGGALPRAVPSDAVVAVVDAVVPGMLLEKLVLAGSLVAAGLGAARLAGPRLSARLVAVSLAVWNPFVVERLWLGHWTVLVGYACLPWLAGAAIRARREQRVPATLPLLLPLASLSASAGVTSAVVVLALGLSLRREGGSRRTSAWLVLAVVAANAPWLVAGMLHAGTADITASTAQFGLHGDGLPAPLAALSMAGIWNAQVVPGTRDGLLLPVLFLAFLVALAALGWPRARARLGRRTTAGLVGCWAAGIAVAVLTWLAPGAVDALAGAVPGAGLVRDGSRTLALALPLLVVLLGAGAEEVVDRCARRGSRELGLLLAGTAALVPVAVLPDAAWGIGGELRPADYPADWATARSALVDADPPGDLLVLPAGAYRAPDWNHGRTVLDPLGRYLTMDWVSDDTLVVDDVAIPGDDPRIPLVEQALARPPGARAALLADLGIGAVAVEKDASPPAPVAPAVPGTVVADGATLRVVVLDEDVTVRERPSGWVLALALAWSAYVGCALVGVALPVVRTARRGRSGRAP